ncbi:PF07601 family protein [Leptospira interrogans str. HAI1594]|nr:PF07601 family protein [Leptospira interrogans str. HAI1594]
MNSYFKKIFSRFLTLNSRYLELLKNFIAAVNKIASIYYFHTTEIDVEFIFQKL